MHRLLALGTGILVVVSCLLAGAAWRLAQGPIDLARISDRIKAALTDESTPVRVEVGGFSLAWEGFHKGVDHPLDVRLSRITVTDLMGRRLLTAPNAHLTFSFAGLLLGRIVPRSIEVDHAQIGITREVGGAIDLGWDLVADGSPSAGAVDLRQLHERLARPASTDRAGIPRFLDQIRRIHFRDTELTIRDDESGLVIRTPSMDLDLARTAGGHIRGTFQAPLSIGDQQASLAADADWVPGSDIRLGMKLTSLRPAGINAFPSALAFMMAVDVPVSLVATVRLDPGFRLQHIQAELGFGQGSIRAAQGTVPIRSGDIAVSGTLDKIDIARAHIDLAHSPEGSAELIDITGIITHEADRLSASITVGLGQIELADLPRLWPAGVGAGARSWIVEHITAGTVKRGAASLVIEADDSLHDIMLTQARGDVDGSSGIFTWIDNIPPVEQTDFHLHLVDPDTLDISVSSAHQRVHGGDPDLLIKDGWMRITGLSLRDQIAAIRAQVEGPIASALSLLDEPRLHLLSSHPIALKTGAGDGSVTLDFQFPLENKLEMDDVRIHADAHLTKIRLPGIVGGQDLDSGVFDLSIDKDGLRLRGRGAVATVPVTINGTMDFNSGPPDQVVQQFAVTGQPEAAQLEAAGVKNITDFLSGPVPLTVAVVERRSGNGSIVINGDLTLATLTVDALAWSKPSGTLADASAILLTSHDRVVRIDRIMATGDGLALAGSAAFADGRIRTLLMDAIRLGRTQGHGTVHFGTGEPIGIVLQGDQIDLSAKLTERRSGSNPPGGPQVTTPAWTMDARFDHAILANGERADDVLVKARGEGKSIGLLDVIGATQGAASFSIKIEARAGKRRLLVETKDAGRFLKAIDAVRGMQSGHLIVDGIINGPSRLYPLAGTATIDQVVIKNSPALGKLLQAITLYGLVDALRGPGMTFSRIIVPFHYDGNDLSLDQVQAFNPSLGLTAKGRIGLSSGQASLTGTIVPAYFFNSMLGQLPLVGKLFSPEKGGGVFAARFGVDGPIDDPNISINPISALTPGFLRGIFGIFNRPSTVPGDVSGDGG